MKDYISAINDYSKAISLEPKYAKPHHGRGIAKYHMKGYSGALEDFTQAIILDPNHAGGYYWRGYIKYFLQDKQGMNEDIETAVALNPSDKTGQTIVKNITKKLGKEVEEGAIEKKQPSSSTT